MRQALRQIAAACCGLWLLCAALPARGADEIIQPAAVDLGRPVDFEQDIFPILDANCIACHNLAIKENNLNLEDVEHILKGGKRGPSVIAKEPEKSLLFKVVSRMAPAMPPLPNKVEAKALTPKEVGLIKQWIIEGAGAGAGTGSAAIQWQRIPSGIQSIYSVALTADGQYVACGRANQIYVYYVPTGELVTKLVDAALLDQKDAAGQPLFGDSPAHRDFVHSLAFSPDGTLLASGGYRTVKLWKRPENVRRYEVPAIGTAVAASADGKWLATASADFSIKVWNLADGKPAKSLAGHTAAVSTLQFTPDSLKLVSGSADQSLRVWDITAGTAIGRIDTPSAVNTLAIKEDALTIVSGGADNLLRTWAFPTTAPRQVLAPAAPVAAMEVSPDRKTLAIANADGKIDLIDIATGMVTKSLAGHTGVVSSLAFGANGAKLISGGADKAVRVWDLATGMAVTTLRGGAEPVSAVALNVQGTQAVSGAANGSVSIWKLDVPEARVLGGDNGAAPTVAAVSLDGKLLATSGVAGGKPAILVRDITSGNVTQTIPGHEGEITALAFSPDNTKLASGSADKTARVWNIADAKELAKFALHTNTVTGVAFTPNAAQVASGAADNSLKLWNVADAAEVKAFAGHAGAVTSVAVLANGQIVSGSADQTIRIWNPADGAQVRAITHGQPVAAFALTRDGNTLAAAGGDNSVKLYRFGDGGVLFTLAGHTAPAKALNFTADNLKLISTGADNQAIVWEVATGLLQESFPVEAGLSFAAFTSVTPNALLLGSTDKSIRVTTLHFERPLVGNMKAITDLLYSKGGDAIFTASEDGTVRRYVPANGQQQFSANHGAPVYDIDLSFDNGLLASAGENKQVHVWNAGNGGNAPKPVLEGFTAAVKSVCFSLEPQNPRVIGGDANGTVIVFNQTANALPEQWFLEQKAPIEALVAAGEKGTDIISSAGDKTIRSWSLAAGIQIPGHTGPVTAVAFVLPPNGQVISGSQDGTVRVWTLANAAVVRQMAQGGPVTALAVRPDGVQFASAGENNVAKLWTAANGQQVGTDLKGDLRDQKAAAEVVADEAEAKAKVAATAALIKTAETDSTAKADAVKKAIEAQTTATTALAGPTAKAKEANDKFVAAKAAADGKTDDAALAKAKTDAEKALADANAELKKVEDAKKAADKGVELAMRAAKEAVDLIAKHTAANQAATALQMKLEGDVKVAQMAAATKEKPIRAIAFSADGKVLATGGDDNLVHTWNTVDGSPLALYTGHAGPIQAVAFTANKGLVSISADQTAKVWELSPAWTLTGQLGPKPDAPLDVSMSPLVSRVLSLGFSGDGKLLATGGGDPSRSGELMIWDVAQKSLVKNIVDSHSDTVFDLEFSKDGKYLVSGAADKFVKIFDVATGKVFKSFEGHTHHVLGVSWQADQSRIVSAGADNAIKVWNVETGEQERTIPGYTKQVTSIQFIGRSVNFVSCGGDATVRYHRADNAQNYRNFTGAKDYMYAAASTPDEKIVVAGGEDGILRIWNGVNAAVVLTLEPPKPADKPADTQAAATTK